MDTTVTVTLPDDPAEGTVYIVKDKTGEANTNNMTIATAGSDTIDGAGTATISANWGSLALVYDASGNNWLSF